MNSPLDGRIAAAFLASGRALALAGYCAAIIGAAGVLLAHSPTARLLFAGAVMCLPAILYFSLRVAIDSSLFREIDLEGGEASAFDAWLEQHGMRRAGLDRSLDSRIRGALALWRRLVAVATLAVGLAAAGVMVEALAR